MIYGYDPDYAEAVNKHDAEADQKTSLGTVCVEFHDTNYQASNEVKTTRL